MANILDRYGIKEVADVVFYEIDKDTAKPSNPVLFLDTLKVSTIEQTAEEAEARGGKGNAALIAWDYGKEITVTLEDALFSAKSMAIMFGDGKVKNIDSLDNGMIMKTIYVVGAEKVESWTAPSGMKYVANTPKFYDEFGDEVSDDERAKEENKDKKYFCTFGLKAAGAVIDVSANSFPGTYYVVGDTYARSEVSGEDEMFQFIIPKAKVTSENTITLEAEGDPSVFNMNLKVLRPADGVMMRLVKYEFNEEVVAG
jgi:hypothetical protein